MRRKKAVAFLICWALVSVFAVVPGYAEEVANNEWRKVADHMDWPTYVVVDLFEDEPSAWLTRRRTAEWTVGYVCPVADPVRIADIFLELWDASESRLDFDPAQEVARYVSYVHGKQEGHWYLQFAGEDDVPEFASATLDVRVLEDTAKFSTFRQGDAWSVSNESYRSQTLSELIAGGNEAWMRLSVEERGISTYRIATGQGFREASGWVDDQCNKSETILNLRKEWPRERLGAYLISRRKADVEMQNRGDR